MGINKENHEKILLELIDFYQGELIRYRDLIGGNSKLSNWLGLQKSVIEKIINKGYRLSTKKRIVSRCYDRETLSKEDFLKKYAIDSVKDY